MALQNGRFTVKGRVPLSTEQETRRPQKESGRFGEGKIISPFPGIEKWFISPAIRYAVIKPLPVFQAT